jgi:hypothetical protein
MSYTLRRGERISPAGIVIACRIGQDRKGIKTVFFMVTWQG